MFGSKLLSSFLVSAIYSKHLRYRQRQAVVTLKICNQDLDRLGAIYFLDPSPLLFGFHPHFGNHWLGSTTNRCVQLRRQVACFFTSVPSRGDNRLWFRFRKNTTIFALCVDCGMSGSNIYKFVQRTCGTFPNLQYCLNHICKLYC